MIIGNFTRRSTVLGIIGVVMILIGLLMDRGLLVPAGVILLVIG